MAALASDSQACSFAPLPVHMLDQAEQGVDVEAPQAPQTIDYQMLRNPETDTGCGGTVNSCDGSSQIGLSIAGASDDRTPAGEIGYVIDVVAGDGANLLNLGPLDDPVRPDESGTIWLMFSDSGQDVDITLSVRAMDLAGNVSDPVAVDVVDSSGGCRSGGARVGAWAPLALVVVLLAAGSRRREQIAISLS